MKTLLIWMWLAQATDSGITCHALKSGKFRESNPILPNSCPKITTIKMSVVAITTLVSLKHSEKHPKLTKIGVAIQAASGSIAVGINVRRIGK